MKLAIVGSRDFLDYVFLESRLNELLSLFTVEEIISGGARGADSLGERFARERGIPVRVFRADWARLGRRAGHLRNKDIVSRADVIVAFWDGLSLGTRDTLHQARRAGKRVILYPVHP